MAHPDVVDDETEDGVVPSLLPRNPVVVTGDAQQFHALHPMRPGSLDDFRATLEFVSVVVVAVLMADSDDVWRLIHRGIFDDIHEP